jgi:hypothetical protein
MKLSDIQVTSHWKDLPSIKQVKAVEQALNFSFPPGYLEYITTLGFGAIGSCVEVFLPEQVKAWLPDWQERIKKYWFWDDGVDILDQQSALACIPFARTVGGDEFIVHPEHQSKIYVLPRESELIYEVGPDLWSMIKWSLTSGVLYDPIEELDFQAFQGKV